MIEAQGPFSNQGFFQRLVNGRLLYFVATEHSHPFDWIGLREILQETIDFPIKYGAFL